jgi:hypothetical protein
MLEMKDRDNDGVVMGTRSKVESQKVQSRPIKMRTSPHREVFSRFW